MRIVVIGRKYIFKDFLPKNIINKYVVSDNTKRNAKKIIDIIMNNGKYEILSNESTKIIDLKYLEIKNDSIIINRIEESQMSSITLKENNGYAIFLKDTKEIYILYCFSDFEDNYTHIDIINTREITIGANDNNSIIIKNPFVRDFHAKIFKYKGKWTIENNDPKFGLFVNNLPVFDNPKDIFNGDIIFIMGLEIIMIKDSLYIKDFRK